LRETDKIAEEKGKNWRIKHSQKEKGFKESPTANKLNSHGTSEPPCMLRRPRTQGRQSLSPKPGEGRFYRERARPLITQNQLASRGKGPLAIGSLSGKNW